VFQDAVVDQPLTGRQNLELHLRLWGVRPDEGRPRLAELTKTVGIDDILDRPVATYSGGQALRNIWGLSNDNQMAALSCAVLALYALVIIVGAVRLFTKASTQ
jgi:ABC-type taurine transport system ATPase subunit